jgi:hypothetical protein
MHKLMLAAAAVCALSAPLAGRAEAGALAGAEAIRPALDTINTTEAVHCVPGRVHRRSPPYDGCYRSVQRAPAYPYAYSYPYGYGYAPGYYGWGPGVSIGFGRRGYWGPGIGFGFGF